MLLLLAAVGAVRDVSDAVGSMTAGGTVAVQRRPTAGNSDDGASVAGKVQRRCVSNACVSGCCVSGCDTCTNMWGACTKGLRHQKEAEVRFRCISGRALASN